MLKRLHLRNFTVFADADFEFVQGLNVIVGTNGTGKSHVLKVGYAALSNLLAQLNRKQLQEDEALQNSLHDFWEQSRVETKMETKLERSFQQPSSELIRRGTLPESSLITYTIGGEINQADLTLQMRFTEYDMASPTSDFLSKASYIISQLASPVFIPAKEILTLGWMLQVSREYKLPIDETYLDLLKKLGRLSLQNPDQQSVKAINVLNELLGGEIEESGGDFYLKYYKQRRMNINLVAEGLRKFGAIQKLLSNGSLIPKATLFWDEPEANLNPALLRKLAAVLAELAGQGFQIILATHSMSLLKEFHILSRKSGAQPFPLKYFGLNAEAGEATQVVTADNFELLPDVVALEVELEQADDLDEIFAKEDQEPHADL